MDYTLATTGISADMSFAKSADIRNNIFLSLTIRQGTWWADPLFGLRDRGRMKITSQTVRLLRGDCLEALQWILDSGRAKSLEVTVLRDTTENLNRVKASVEAVQADGRRVTFDKFIEVV